MVVVFEQAVEGALRELGVGVEVRQRGADHDIVLMDGTVLEVQHRALIAQHDAMRWVDLAESHAGSRLFLVGDRITGSAREILARAGIGFFDLRGHLRLRTPSIAIDTEVPSLAPEPERRDPLKGRAGWDVAVAILLDPTRSASVRGLARELDRSPGTVSDLLSAFRADDLVGADHRPRGTGLFWALADRWPSRRTYLRERPPELPTDHLTDSLRMGLPFAEHTTGWAVTENRAALAYGAPVALRSDHLVDYYVPDRTSLNRAVSLLGPASSSKDAACAVRVAPVRAVCARRNPATPTSVWPLANPLFVALDLAQDQGRGREILRSWEPPTGVQRVW